MFTTVLARMDNVYYYKYVSSPFTDTDINTWYGPSVAWAAEKGILNGYGNGCFGPEDNITREQMAVILSNYIKYKGLSFKAVGSGDVFADDTQISPWAQNAVSDIKKYGIISGTGNNGFNPAGIASMAEVAQVFTNYITTLAK